MLSHEDNELLTRTGPGTAMGDLIRRYWIPVVQSKELEPAAGSSGCSCSASGSSPSAARAAAPALIAEFCPHRGASLFFGRIEEAGMRCVYHGWKFGLDGRCLEMPSEPPESSFTAKVSTTAYPCAERGGVIWAYMGPEPAAAAARARVDAAAGAHVFVSKRVQDCNWFQALEGGIDSSHISFLHAPIDHATREVTQDMDRVSFGVGAAVQTGDRAPRFEVVDTDYGALIGARRPSPTAAGTGASPSSCCRSTRCRPPTSTRRSCSPTSGCRWTTPTW